MTHKMISEIININNNNQCLNTINSSIQNINNSDCSTPNPPTKILPNDIAGLKLSGKSPMYLGIQPPLNQDHAGVKPSATQTLKSSNNNVYF